MIWSTCAAKGSLGSVQVRSVPLYTCVASPTATFRIVVPDHPILHMMTNLSNVKLYIMKYAVFILNNPAVRLLSSLSIKSFAHKDSISIVTFPRLVTCGWNINISLSQ